MGERPGAVAAASMRSPTCSCRDHQPVREPIVVGVRLVGYTPYGLPGSKNAMLSTGQIVVDVKPDAPAMNRAESAVIVVDSRAASSIEMSQLGLGP
jgi:hypothetical protein